MLIVDSHCHASPAWFEPVESLLNQMDRHGVQHAVLIQQQYHHATLIEYSSPTNNDYLFECARRFPGRFAVVVTVDVARPDAPQTLERLAQQGASGIHLRQTMRSPGADPLAIWRAAARLGLSVSCSGRSPYYGTDEFAELVQALPGLPIVIEHLGSGNHPDAEDVPPAVRHNAFRLARFPNVYIKVPGLGEFCRRAQPVRPGFPFERPIPPLLDLAYEAFGPERMMWGSDYPPVSAREGFGNALRLTMEQFRNRSEDKREQLFGLTALKVFPLRI